MAVIAINQQLGSRGVELGQLAARELGYRFFGRAELISLTASAYHVDSDQFLVIDERQPHFWERPKIDTVRLISFLRAVFFREMAQDRVIFVSSSGAHLLPVNGCGLRVRVIGSTAARVAQVMEAEKLTQAAAEKRVRDHDREVRARAQTLYSVDIDEPALYHLVLNSSVIGLEALAASLKSCAEQLDSCTDGRGLQELRDAGIAAQVRAALLSNSKFGHAPIDVVCAEGTVQISGPGLVPPWSELASEIACQIEGVRSCGISDEEIPMPIRGE